MVDGIRPIRNQYLTRLLASTPLMGGFAVEDRGWGFAAIREALEKGRSARGPHPAFARELRRDLSEAPVADRMKRDQRFGRRSESRQPVTKRTPK